MKKKTKEKVCATHQDGCQLPRDDSVDVRCPSERQLRGTERIILSSSREWTPGTPLAEWKWRRSVCEFGELVKGRDGFEGEHSEHKCQIVQVLMGGEWLTCMTTTWPGRCLLDFDQLSLAVTIASGQNCSTFGNFILFLL